MATASIRGPSMVTLFLTVFVDTVGFGIVLPLQPYLAQLYGASALTVTSIVSVYALAQFIFGPIWARLSDRIGRRPVILITICGGTIGYAGLAFADSLALIFLARAFSAAMGANFGAVQAYIADVTPPERRAQGMGRIGAAHGLGFVTGPAIGGLFAGHDVANPDFATPFLIASGLSALAFLMALFTLRESLAPEHRAAAGGGGRLAAFLDALRRPPLGQLLMLLVLTPFVFSMVESTFVLWSKAQLGWTPVQNGLVYTFMGLVAVVVPGLVVGRLTRLVGERRAILIGSALAGSGALLLPFMDGYVGLCAAFGLIVGGVTINNPCVNSLISQQAGPGERGRLLGVAQACGAAARMTGPQWGGFTFDAFGHGWPFFSGAGVMAVTALLAFRLRIGRPEAAKPAFDLDGTGPGR